MSAGWLDRRPIGVEIAIVVGAALVIIAALLGVRAATAEDPLRRLTSRPTESGDPPGTQVRTGQVATLRGGPYRFALQSPGPARLEINGQAISLDPMQPTRLLLDVHASRIRVAAPPGARLMWHPPGRVTHHALEYLPASSLKGDDVERFDPDAGRSRGDAVIAAAIVLTLAGAALVLARRRLRAAGTTVLLATLAVLALAVIVRWQDIDGAGQTWDEDVNWSAGRNYAQNALALDAAPRSWIWNYEHPPVSKYLHGIGALWDDGYTGARAVMGLVIAIGCALLVPIGARLWSLRAGGADADAGPTGHRTQRAAVAAGVIAGVAAALYPSLVAHGKVVGHEAPAVLWWSLAMLLCLGAHDAVPPGRDARRGRLEVRMVGLGIVLGLAVASRFVNGLMAAPIGLTLLLLAPPGERRRTILLGFGIIPLVALLTVIAVWPRLWVTPLANLAQSWARLRSPHSPEPYLGRITNTPPASYFLVYLYGTAPVGLLIAALVGAGRCARAVARWRLPALAGDRRAAVLLLVWFLAPLGAMLSPVRQDGVRYVMPCLTMLALLAGAGLDGIAAAIAPRVRRSPALVAAGLGAALAAYLAVVCIRIHPYYLDYFGEQVGGPIGVVADRRFEVGWWGEGLGEAVDFVNREAAPGARLHRECIEPAHVAWFRGDLWPAMVRDPKQAEWIVFYEPMKGPCPIPSDARLVHSVTAMGAPLVQVYRRQPLAAPAPPGHSGSR